MLIGLFARLPPFFRSLFRHGLFVHAAEAPLTPQTLLSS
jgi:hypothetical protein